MTNPRLSVPIISAETVQVNVDAPMIKVIEAIDRSPAKIALVVDASGKLVGAATDGDVRRCLLKGASLQSPAREAMHGSPVTMPEGSSKQDILEKMHALSVKQVPLVNASGKLVGIVIYDMLTGFNRTPRSNPIVIMAGGKGRRLLPLTNDLPKPMIEVSGKPMLEHILLQFTKQGFSQFYFAVNYLSHVIEEYFGDGSKWNCYIHYLRESQFMGTAGALSLLGARPEEPFVVINGDILTTVDFGDLIDFHMGSGGIATVCARHHRMEVPYGVIRLKGGLLETIVEKPVHEDLISAGIYCFNPEVLDYIPAGSVTDMPSVLLALAKNMQKVAVYPMREDWVDVGRHDDLELAKHKLAQNS